MGMPQVWRNTSNHCKHLLPTQRSQMGSRRQATKYYQKRWRNAFWLIESYQASTRWERVARDGESTKQRGTLKGLSYNSVSQPMTPAVQQEVRILHACLLNI